MGYIKTQVKNNKGEGSTISITDDSIKIKFDTNYFLENEKIELEKKIIQARENGSENTYKNLIQAYERILELIRKENKWEDKYSHYKLQNDNGEWEEVVSTWEQKGEDIKNHKTYKVVKWNNNSNYISLNINGTDISEDLLNKIIKKCK